MRIGLIAVDSKHPNLALMKISAYHKGNGDDVQWYEPFGEYDRVYMSKIFNFTPDYTYAIGNAKEVFKGGTGYSLTTELPPEIDRIQPDYSIYPEIDPRVSYGFLTRGCPNKCKWCVVPKKEGKTRPYMDIDEITLEGQRPKAILMDNNILATDYGLQQIEKIAEKRYWVDFNQAMDARLVTPEIAELLARCRWINSIMRFGCDTPAQIAQCERVLRLLMEKGYKGQFQLYCIIMGDIHECVERISYWKRDPVLKKKIRVTAQPFRDPFLAAHPLSLPSGSDTWRDGQTERSSTQQASSGTSDSQRPLSVRTTSKVPLWQQDLAHWANKRQAYHTCSFEEFMPRKGFKCIEHLKNGNIRI